MSVDVTHTLQIICVCTEGWNLSLIVQRMQIFIQRKSKRTHVEYASASKHETVKIRLLHQA